MTKSRAAPWMGIPEISTFEIYGCLPSARVDPRGHRHFALAFEQLAHHPTGLFALGRPEFTKSIMARPSRHCPQEFHLRIADARRRNHRQLSLNIRIELGRREGDAAAGLRRLLVDGLKLAFDVQVVSSRRADQSGDGYNAMVTASDLIFITTRPPRCRFQ